MLEEVQNFYQDLRTANWEVGELGKVTTIDDVREKLSAGDATRKDLLTAAFTFVYNLAPEATKYARREKRIAKVPLRVKLNERDYRVMEYVGMGGKNVTYLLEAEQSGAEKDYAIGLLFPVKTPTTEEAIAYARNRKADYEKVHSLYGHIPWFMPKEEYVVYENHKGEPSVMYVREFVHGKKTDIFNFIKDNPIKFSDLLKNNKLLKEQLSEFLQVSFENEEFVVNEQLDLLGVNNLVVVENEDEVSLMLMDPHTRYAEKTGAKSADIKRRLYGLKEVLDQSLA